MSEPADPAPFARQPLPRIGDAERDRAVDALQTHLAEGRLDREEFDERLSRALGARTAADLQPLFDDLPEPRPATGLATTPAYEPPPWTQAAPAAGTSPATVPPAEVPERPAPLAANLVVGLIWPLVVVICFATSWNNWWLFIVAAIITGAIRKTWPGVDGHHDRH